MSLMKQTFSASAFVLFPFDPRSKLGRPNHHRDESPLCNTDYPTENDLCVTRACVVCMCACVCVFQNVHESKLSLTGNC